MSEGFHVHGADEHAVEHEAHQGNSLAQMVAIFTALLSTLGAILSYQGGLAQNEAMLLKNEAVLKRTQASDQWNFYEAKSNKAHMMSVAADLLPPKKATYYRTQIEKYEKEKKEIKKKAESFEQEFKDIDAESEHVMAPHQKLAQAMTLIQIAISLASVTVLTRKKWLLLFAGISALAGGLLWIWALGM